MECEYAWTAKISPVLRFSGCEVSIKKKKKKTDVIENKYFARRVFILRLILSDRSNDAAKIEKCCETVNFGELTSL